MYKPWKSWKLVLGNINRSFWKKTGVQKPKRSSFEEFGAVWSRSRLCCSRSASSQRVENFRRIASLCNFLLAINTSQSRKFFQRIASKVTYCSRSNPKNSFSAVRKTSWSRSDTSWSRSISGISKNPAYKLSDLTHFCTKTLQILSTPSESADKHNPTIHSC